MHVIEHPGPGACAGALALVRRKPHTRDRRLIGPVWILGTEGVVVVDPDDAILIIGNPAWCSEVIKMIVIGGQRPREWIHLTRGKQDSLSPDVVFAPCPRVASHRTAGWILARELSQHFPRDVPHRPVPRANTNR